MKDLHALPAVGAAKALCRDNAGVRPHGWRDAVVRCALRVTLCLLLCHHGEAFAQTSGAMQSLDEQVQEIKSDVLAIASELQSLEEKLLYPADTQIAIFVSLSEGNELDLDSVRIQIDAENVASHIYSFKEVDALRRGGVQRIYTGNLPTGEHQIEVVVSGKLPGGGRFEEAEQATFRKDVEPKLVGLALATTATGGARVTVGEW